MPVNFPTISRIAMTESKGYGEAVSPGATRPGQAASAGQGVRSFLVRNDQGADSLRLGGPTNISTGGEDGAAGSDGAAGAAWDGNVAHAYSRTMAPNEKVDFSLPNSPEFKPLLEKYNSATDPQSKTAALKKIISEFAREKGIPEEIVLAQATLESGLDPNHAGDGGDSIGLVQVRNCALDHMKEQGQISQEDLSKLNDPETRQNPVLNLELGWRHLSNWMNDNGGAEAGLSGYVSGDSHSQRGQDYIANLTRIANFYKQNPEYKTNGVNPLSAGLLNNAIQWH